MNARPNVPQDYGHPSDDENAEFVSQEGQEKGAESAESLSADQPVETNEDLASD